MPARLTDSSPWPRKSPGKTPAPVVARSALDPALLQACGRPAGLALRVGAWPGPFDPAGAATAALCDLTQSLIRDARARGLAPSEFQIDFDAAQSKLDGYRLWLQALRRAAAPVPLTFTALPSWLAEPAFPSLAAAADGWVLQVHSLARPRSISDPFTLCDPAAARAAVERASRLGLRFRAALPTYGYSMAFDASGRFLGLSASGQPSGLPAGARLREVRADPEGVAGLVAGWTRQPPPGLLGLIWYRLPVADESLNWRWPALARVLDGQVPRPLLKASLIRPRPGLLEIELANQGEADFSGPVRLEAAFPGARAAACDGLAGFGSAPAPGVLLLSHPSLRLPPGERLKAAWLRLAPDVPATVRIVSAAP